MYHSAILDSDSVTGQDIGFYLLREDIRFFIPLREVLNLFYVLKKRNEKYSITTKGMNGRDI